MAQYVVSGVPNECTGCGVCRGMRCSLFAAQEFVMVRHSVRTDDSEEGFNVFHNAYYENILETITININLNSIQPWQI